MDTPPTIAMIAGETSGDQLGGWLMAALRAKNPVIRFVGIGGDRMEEAGLRSIFPIRDIALLGIAEVLPHIFTIKRRIRQMVEYIEQEKPDMLISIDSPGFVLRVVKQLRARGKVRPKLVHYVAPSVWAYRPERAKLMAERFDFLLCLLPFEPPYFDAVGLPNRFIGHEIAWWWKSRGDGAAFRQRFSIAENAPLLAVFPGSRRGEIRRLWPIFKASITQLAEKIPNLQVVIQLQPNLIGSMQKDIEGLPQPPLIISNAEHKKDLFAAATAAMAKSGTIGLECALAGLPGVIAYRTNRVTAYLLRRMIKIRFANLANLLANKMIIPELLQENCTAEAICDALFPILTNAQARETQRLALADIAGQLGAGDAISPSEKAAETLLALLERR